MRLRDRALILPADCSVPEAYYLGYEKAIDEILEDLMELGIDSYYDINNVIPKLIEKWEAKKNE